MILELTNIKDVGFIVFIISKIQEFLYRNINPNKLQKLELYINNVPEYKSPYRKYISCKDVIISGSQNLIYRKQKNGYIIQINNNVYYPGLEVKVYTLCRLIEYGTIDIQGVDYFHQAYNYIIDNLDALYKEYEGR